MITLAIAAAFFYFVNQNYAIFNGHSGIFSVATPTFWGVDWRSPIPFYYVTLGLAAICYWATGYLARAPFGLALQGVRDNPRRMAALGFNVNAHRVAAYVFASLVAAIAGILLVWSNGQISPGSVGVDSAIDILVIAVVGGVSRPIGPFVGALIYVVLRTFALDFLVAIGLDGNRFRLLVGLGFPGDRVLVSRWGNRPVDALAQSRTGLEKRGPGRWRPWIASRNASLLSAPAMRWSCAASPGCLARSLP